MNLPQLDENILQINFMDDLIDTFIDRWNMYKPKRRSDRIRLE